MEEVWGQSILKRGGDIYMFVKSRFEIIWEKNDREWQFKFVSAY